MQSRKTASRLLITIWILGTITAVWAFEGRYLLPVKPVQASQLPTATLGKVTLTIAWGADCACSQDEVDHLRDLLKTDAPKGLQLKVLLPCKPSEAEHALQAWKATAVGGLAQADVKGVECLKLGLTATPAAIVQDRDGTVVYQGSIHAGRFCHDADLAYAAKAVESCLAGRKPIVQRAPFYGCAIGPY